MMVATHKRTPFGKVIQSKYSHRIATLAVPQKLMAISIQLSGLRITFGFLSRLQ
jgi:hypothetical protein